MFTSHELACKINEWLQKQLRGRLTFGWVWVDDEQFDVIGQVVPEYTNVATLRRQHGVDDLMTHEVRTKPEPEFAALCSVLDIHVKELLNGMEEATQRGKRLALSTYPQVHFRREAYTLEIFIWLHYRLAFPARSQLDIQEARRIVREADDAASRAGAPKYGF